MSRRVLLGTTDAGKRVPLPAKARDTHMHILGASGRGKSKFIEGLVRQDILNREGLCLIDPHGHLYEEIVRWCTRQGFLRDRNIVLLDPAVDGWSFGFNPLNFGNDSPYPVFANEARPDAAPESLRTAA